MSDPDDANLLAQSSHSEKQMPSANQEPSLTRSPKQTLKSFGTVGYAIDLINVVNEKPRWLAKETTPRRYGSSLAPKSEIREDGAEMNSTSAPGMLDAPIDEPRELRFLTDAICGDMKQLSGGGVVFILGGHTLTVDAAWRITGPGGVLLSRTGQQNLFSAGAPVSAVELLRALLGQSKVVAAVADERLGDLAIAFSGGLCLEVWNDASGVDAWSLQDGTKNVWRGTPRGIVIGPDPAPDGTE